MQVKTIRKHSNAFGPVFQKNVGRIYEVPDGVGRNLIAAGLVEEYAAPSED